MARSLLFRFGLVFFACISLINLSCKKNQGPVGPDAVVPSTLGQLVASPGGILVGTPTEVTIRLTVPAGIRLVDSTVKVVRLNASGQQTGDISVMYDDGLLSHGDEIIGDNTYSTIVSLNESAAGPLRMRATATLKSPTPNFSGTSSDFAIPIYSNLTPQEYGAIVSTYDSSETKVKQFLAAHPSNLSSVVTQLAGWLQTRPEIASVQQSSGNGILIRFASGLNGGIIISQKNSSGFIDTRGGLSPAQQRRVSKAVPLKNQTTGTTWRTGLRKVSAPGAIDPNVIGNRNVLIFAPFEEAFPANERPTAVAILQNSGYEFSITALTNQSATVAALTHLTDYGFVLLATHGSQGKEFGTGEIVDTNAALYKSTYKAMLKGGDQAQLSIWNTMVIDAGWIFDTHANVYAIRAPFINGIAGTFPNSVIVNNSCESTMNPDLSTAFLGKGAKTYYGYDKVVNCGFCVTNADTIMKRLTTDLKNTGQSYVPASDPRSPNATIAIVGGQDVHYADSLINGDFEFGKLDGWTRSGDGRVISQLSSVAPTGGSYMGIISTGLGFTTSSGSIFQTFRVTQGQTTLTVKWNFLSEEFPEYIGSSYQDYFEIVVKHKDGSEDVLVRKTIDGLASEFGATKVDPGSLIGVSPDIIFDRGGVFMTRWQTSTLGVSAYVGQRVTLILRAGDVGDSIFDTAIVLDDIAVN